MGIISQSVSQSVSPTCRLQEVRTDVHGESTDCEHSVLGTAAVGISSSYVPCLSCLLILVDLLSAAHDVSGRRLLAQGRRPTEWNSWGRWTLSSACISATLATGSRKEAVAAQPTDARRGRLRSGSMLTLPGLRLLRRVRHKLRRRRASRSRR